jgi:hypothetical protein
MANKVLTSEQKQMLKALREQIGGITPEKREQQRHLLAARKAIRKLLEDGPATVPQIAESTSMPSAEALWHIAGMRKYGQVSEAGEDGDYVLYTLVVDDSGKLSTGH